jgi:hypothetical protein
VWDLVAAMYLIEPGLFRTRSASASMPVPGWMRFGRGRRAVVVVERFDRDTVWNRFLDLLSLRG